MLMVVGGPTRLYNICAKSHPGEAQFLRRPNHQLWGGGGTVPAAVFVTTGGEKNLIQEIGKTNWAPVVMGAVRGGPGAGLYPDLPGGMEGQCGSLVANLALACILVLVGVLWYKEVLTGHQILGIGACVVGILLISR